MISPEQVKRALAGVPPERIAQLLAPALEGEFIMPLSGGPGDEPPEDFFSQLLLAADTPEEMRRAITDECLRLFVTVLPAVLTGPHVPGEKTPDIREQVFVRLCRLVDVAKPEALREIVPSLLVILLNQKAVRPEVLGASVRAAMAYVRQGQDAALWECLLERPALAAYGFHALLAVGLPEPEAVAKLVTLWQRHLEEGWPTDVAFLTVQASRHAGFDDSLIVKVLSALRERLPHLWPMVKTKLGQRSLTRQWLDLELSVEKPAGESLRQFGEWLRSTRRPERNFLPVDVLSKGWHDRTNTSEENNDCGRGTVFTKVFVDSYAFSPDWILTDYHPSAHEPADQRSSGVTSPRYQVKTSVNTHNREIYHRFDPDISQVGAGVCATAESIVLETADWLTTKNFPADKHYFQHFFQSDPPPEPREQQLVLPLSKGR